MGNTCISSPSSLPSSPPLLLLQEEEEIHITPPRIDLRASPASETQIFTWKDMFMHHIDNGNYKEAIRNFTPEYGKYKKTIDGMVISQVKHVNIVLYWFEYAHKQFSARIDYCLSLIKNESYIIVDDDNGLKDFRFHTHFILLLRIISYRIEIRKNAEEEEEEMKIPIYNISDCILFRLLLKMLNKQAPFVFKLVYEQGKGVGEDVLFTSPHIYILAHENVIMKDLLYRGNEYFKEIGVDNIHTFEYADMSKFDFIVRNSNISC